MLALSDIQLRTVMDLARNLPVEKRSLYLERSAAMLKARGRITDADVSEVAKRALACLVHDDRQRSMLRDGKCQSKHKKNSTNF